MIAVLERGEEQLMFEYKVLTQKAPIANISPRSRRCWRTRSHVTAPRNLCAERPVARRADDITP
jgi:hypothetical protein